METASRTTIETYLHTSYEPDAEYVDGEIRERRVGTVEHANWQGVIVGWFLLHRGEWKLRPLPEVRILTGPEHYRIPDVALVEDTELLEHCYLSHPPVATFEILSPNDTWSEVVEKSLEYADMGVSQVWIVDPIKGALWQCRDKSFVPSEVFALPGRGIQFEWEAVRALLTPAG